MLSNGLIYGWGWNRWGQLALEKVEEVEVPQIIEINGNHDKFKYIYCCYNSSFAITTNGLLFNWGYNYWGLSREETSKNICFPRKVNLFNVQKISNHYSTCYFLTKEGSIYFCNQSQKKPRIIQNIEGIFTDIESNFCSDNENIIFELNHGEFEPKGKLESLIEFFC